MTATPAEPAPPVEAPEPPDGEDPGQTPDGEDQPLGPAGQKALDAEKAKRRDAAARARTAEARAAELEAELAAAKKGQPPADGPDLDAIRADAIREATKVANARVVAAEVRAAATGKLATPALAASLLANDLASVHVGADGSVDGEQIEDLIAGLLTRYPELAKTQAPGPRFTGAGDGGARPPAGEKTLEQQITDAQKAGDLQTVMRLKSRSLLAIPTT